MSVLETAAGDSFSEKKQKKLSICIVTAECVGPFKNGGIGTSMTGLAEVLANAGHVVTIYYTRGIHLTNSEIKHWIRVYNKININFVALRQKDLSKYIGPLSELGYTVPCSILNYLISNKFDVVHFNDTDAEGFLAIAAHRLAGLSAETVFLLAMHSPREWVYELNRVPAAIPVNVLMQYAERLSGELIDVMWCPSRYLIEWVKSKNWTLPDNIVQQQYVIPSKHAFQKSLPNSNVDNISSLTESFELNKIVFFGRLEERKGLRLFLESINRILPILKDADIKIVFLGKSVQINGKSSKSFITDYTHNWDLSWEIISNLGQPEAINYLLKQGCLAVMPSPSDNSPCTVYEAIEAGIPFLAARTGGIPELIHPEDSERVLFDYNIESLVNLLCFALNNIKRVRPNVTRDENINNWIELHDKFVRFEKSNPVQHGRSTFVLIEDISSIEAIVETLDSLRHCEDLIQEIIVITTRTDNYYQTLRDIKTVLPDELINYIKNTLENINDATFLFIYSGVRIVSLSLEELLSSLSDNMADGMTPSSNIDGGYQCHTFGGSIALSFIYGPASTGAVLLDSEAIYKALECNAEVDSGPFAGLPDRAVASGANIWPYPKPILELSENILGKLQPEITISRIRLYSQVNTTAREGLLLIAATATRSGLLASLMRTMGYRFMRSKCGFLFPLVYRLKQWMS